MKLSDDVTEQLFYCVVELIDRRRRNGVPVPGWMAQLGQRLNLASLSATGTEFDSGSGSLTTDHLIGSVEAAAILGISPRMAQRLATDLDGEKVSGRWTFRRSTVIEYAEGKRDG